MTRMTISDPTGEHLISYVYQLINDLFISATTTPPDITATMGITTSLATSGILPISRETLRSTITITTMKDITTDKREQTGSALILNFIDETE